MQTASSFSTSKMLSTKPVAASVSLTCNGAVRPLPLGGVHQLLKEQPDGAYTTALLTSCGSVVDWSAHRSRLLSGMASFHAYDPNKYARLHRQLVNRGTTLEAHFSAAIVPHIRSALQQYASTAVDLPAAGMMTLLVCDAAASTEDVDDSLLDVHMLCKEYVAPDPHTAVEVAVMGGPRTLPHVKRSHWVQERQYLEDTRPPGAVEVLLCDSAGSLLEGLVTNVFIIAESAELPGQMVLHVPPPNAPYLPGLLQQRVLQAAQQLRLPVSPEAAHPHSRSTWREAFLTNCLRGVQPVKRIYCPTDNHCGLSPWDYTLPMACGPLTNQLQAAVADLQELTPFYQLL